MAAHLSMTTETSNAREWVSLLERAVPFLHDEAAKYDDDGSNEPLELAREIETLLASLPSDESALSPASLAFDGGREAAPPPAAARGDVLLQTALRNLPQYISKSGLVGPDKHSAMQCFEVIRAALAAEGVQAGEVECDCPGKGKDDPALHAPNCPARLSQQPEARGVVDDRIESILHKLNEWSRAYPEDIFREPSKDEREWLHATKPGLMDRVSASMGRHMVRLIRDDLRALTAALTGERNG